MASANVSFDQIPSSIRKPGKYLEFNTKLAVRTLPANAQRVIIIAQQLPSSEAPLRPVQIYSDEEAARLCGRGSQAHLMARAAITANPYLDLSLLPVSDAGAGIAAAGSLALTGTATGPGVLSLEIGAFTVAVAVAKNDTAATAAAALIRAVDAEPDLPLSAAAGEGDQAGTITLTAKNAGTLGNAIALSFTGTAPGLGATLTPMSNGQTDPDPSDALEAVFASDYNIYCLPWASREQLVALREHLDGVSHPLEQRGAVGVAAYTGTLDQAILLAGELNAGRISLACLPGTVSTGPEVAAAYAAVMASEEDPARPLNTLDLAGIVVPPVEKRLSRNQQETALKNGVTPLEVGPGGTVQIVRAVSTYTVDAQGVTDVSLLDLTTIRTLDYTRKAVRERVALRFPREKLSSRTAAKVRSEILDVLRKMEELEILEEVEANADGVIVERDLQDVNRLNARIPADVVNGLHIFAGRIDLLL